MLRRHVDALLGGKLASPGGSLLPGAAVQGVQILAIDRAMATEHPVTVASENQKASLDLTASLLTPAIGHIALITALPELTISQSESRASNRPLPVTVRPATCAAGPLLAHRRVSPDQDAPSAARQLPEALITTSYILDGGCSTTCWSRRPT